MKKKLLLWCCAVVALSIAHSSPLRAAGGSDALLKEAASEYAAMRESLVKRYEDAYNRGEELDLRYYQENKKDIISNQVQAWVGAARQPGKPVPSPRYRPLIYQVAR